MTKIETVNWKEFEVKKIFKKPKIKKFNKIPDEDGNIPFVSSSSENNGVVKFANVEPSFDKPCLTVSTNGDNFSTFYHDYSIACSSDVELIYNPKFTKNIYLFLATILQAEKYRYSYGKKAKNNAVMNTIIKLPIDQNGNPDWHYMEEYMKQLWEREREIDELAQSLEQSDIKFDIVNWKEFKIDNLFTVNKSKNIVSDQLSNGKTPYVTRTSLNNGISSYVYKDNFKLNNKNSIIIGGESAKAFYQDRDYLTGNNITILSNDNLNKWIGLFIITVLNQETFKYCYGRAWNKTKIENSIIKLPVDINGEPDWEYMEKYIKSLPFSKYL